MKVLFSETTMFNQPNSKIFASICENNVICDTPLKKDDLVFNEKEEYENYITILYNNKEMLQDINIKLLISHIAEQCDWVYPDYEMTKMFIVIEKDNDMIINSYLRLEVYPPKYTEKEKECILKHQNNNKTYQAWQEIFKYADDFNNNRNYDNYYEYDLELTIEEKKEILDLFKKSKNIPTSKRSVRWRSST